MFFCSFYFCSFLLFFFPGFCLIVSSMFVTVESYPSEALRAELSAQLGLSDRQLQMWFCHRRLKDRKAPTAKRQPKDFQSLVPAGEKELAGSELVRGGMAVQRYYEVPMAPMLPFPLPQRNIAEMRAIAFVESQLGEPLREDGPILGVEFDSLPPDAFGRPIGKYLFLSFLFNKSTTQRGQCMLIGVSVMV